MSKKFSAQKAALTRAQNSGDPFKVLAAVKKAVHEWDTHPDFRGGWPDDWHRWNIALSDAAFAQRRMLLDGPQIPLHIDDL